MAFDLGGIIGGFIPGAQQFTKIAGDVLNIGQALLGGGQQAQAKAPAPAADAFQATAQQQPAAAGGKPADFGTAINQILQALTQIAQMLGQLTGQGGGQQAQ